MATKSMNFNTFGKFAARRQKGKTFQSAVCVFCYGQSYRMHACAVSVVANEWTNTFHSHPCIRSFLLLLLLLTDGFHSNNTEQCQINNTTFINTMVYVRQKIHRCNIFIKTPLRTPETMRVFRRKKRCTCECNNEMDENVSRPLPVLPMIWTLNEFAKLSKRTFPATVPYRRMKKWE